MGCEHVRGRADQHHGIEVPQGIEGQGRDQDRIDGVRVEDEEVRALLPKTVGQVYWTFPTR